MPSLSGTTKEAVAALEFAKNKGATVISFTGHADTPIAQKADYNFTNFAEDDTSSEMFYLQTLLVALSVMRHRGEYDRYEETVAELQTLPRLLVDVKESFEERAAGFAAPSRTRSTTSSRARVRRGRKPTTTACASSRRCSGSVPGRCTPPISSTAPWNWSKRA